MSKSIIHCDKAPNGFDRATITFPDGRTKEFRGYSQKEVQKKAENVLADYEARQNEPHYYDRSWGYQMFIDPPTPWHGRNGTEKVVSFLKWFW